MTTRVSLVRHGEVENPLEIYIGRLPGIALSGEGRRQAMQAAIYLGLRATKSGLPSAGSPSMPAAIYASPLLRARQTAAILASRLPGPKPVVAPSLSEVYTPYDGQPSRVMASPRRAGGQPWDLYTGTEPPFEQPGDVVARARRWLDQVRDQYAGQHIVAVTHGDVIAFTLLWAMGEPVKHQSRAKITRLGIQGGYPSPASISSLSFEGGDLPRIEYVQPYD
jgi:broad specificity phosphatase PhoE